MEIRGFIGISFSDWDGIVSSVIFLPNCNMRCPFCYNRGLVLEPERLPTIAIERVEGYLKANREWLDGVVITGGEPTIQNDLPLLCKRLKSAGSKVKLDTNGTNPMMVSRLIDDDLIDYVAMDIKAPLTIQNYSVACGLDAEVLLGAIKETIRILVNSSIGYEFRTTVVPTIHKSDDIQAICSSIKDCRKYALQNFKSDVNTINPEYQQLKPFSNAEMEIFERVAKRFVPNTVLRC